MKILVVEFSPSGGLYQFALQMAEAQTQAGMRTVLTKVAEDNLPSRRAVEKAGFQPLARMTFERVWLVPHVRLVPLDGGLMPGFMFQEFNR